MRTSESPFSFFIGSLDFRELNNYSLIHGAETLLLVCHKKTNVYDTTVFHVVDGREAGSGCLTRMERVKERSERWSLQVRTN